MKAQLVKRQDRFDLYNASDGSKIASTSSNPMGKLSLKNCEAIANGYDLDELPKIYSGKEIFEDGYDGLINPHTKMFIELAYIKGFQKALEILGDKKFSEVDVREAYNISDIIDEDEFIQSLQQTEWDVEIEMQYHPTFNIVKRDADGCLILRRQDEI